MAIRFVWHSSAGDEDLEVVVPPGATFGDLLTALTGEAGTSTVYVNGVPVPVERLVSATSLCHGSVVSREGPEPRPGSLQVAELRAVGGRSAGERWVLGPGVYRIGSNPDCEIRVSDSTVDRHHAVLTVGDRGQTYCEASGGSPITVNHVIGRGRVALEVGSLIQVGQTVWEFDRETSPNGDAARVCGVFNRPPRIQTSPEMVQIEVPQRPVEPTTQGGPGWATLLVPLVMAGVFAVLFGPMMATFALLGPMMMLANWFEDRRRLRRARSANATEFGNSLHRFARDLQTAGVAQILHRRARLTEAPEVIARALNAHPRLWERRPDHADFMQVGLGTGSVSWEPDLAGPVGDPETGAVLTRCATLGHAPVGLDLSAGMTVGIAGDRDHILSLVRWLVAQAVIHQGPADVRLAVVTDHPADWDWAKWLPHTEIEPASGRRLLAATPGDVDEVLAHLAAGRSPDGPAGPLTVLIVDTDSLDVSRRNKLRDVQTSPGTPMAGIVMAPSPMSLPGLCNVVIEMPDTFGPATCRFPATGRGVSDLWPTGLSAEIMLECARALAGLKDPEVPVAAADLPDLVRLLDLLGNEAPTAQDIVDRWKAAGPIPMIAGPIGTSERGPLVVDLVSDGPHGLIAGTTGSGKSELLRSLIVSLAAAVSPDHLNFALIDYKGGSAFDACARLPHVVGVVTDLDARLGRRALTCLEAELRYREARLREIEAPDLPEYLRKMPEAPLPRLVVVIDEFAALAAELPGFIPSLVDIAQRGRSLGVHLLLATQRPAGVIGENIRANTNLRVALRVHDAADSRDVLDDQGAAAIPRGRAGRGFVRLGPGELIPFQAALVSAGRRPGGPGSIGLRPFRFGWEPPEEVAGHEETELFASDLDFIVGTISAAADQAGVNAPRSVWPPGLPEHLSFREVADAPGRGGRWWAPVGWADEPHRQRQSVWGWEGTNLLFYGMPGSGPARALLTLGSSLATSYQPDRLHIYALDFGTRTLAPLEDLPQVGGVIGPADRERQVRLLRYLQEEVEARRARGSKDGCAVVLLLDNYGGFSASFDHPTDLGHRETLRRIVAEGPGVDVFVVMSADQAAAVPSNLAALVPEKLIFRMADSFDYAALGLPNRDLPDLPDGRAIQVGSGVVVQIADVADSDLSRIAIQAVPPRTTPAAIGVLPRRSDLADVAHRASMADRDWFLPIGIGDRHLEPVGLHLGESEHALIVGPAGSGKSTALRVISIIVAGHRPDVAITALAPRRSPLREAEEIGTLVTDPDGVDVAVLKILADPTPQLVLVDDADDLSDPGGALLRLFRQRRPDVRVVGAGRADALRSMYGHWTQELRKSRQGIALRPQTEVDGELWHTSLPRHGSPVRTPGRGYLINDGRVELVQLAHP